ncbi:DUF302 domain-containing protein [Sulfurovum sp.]|uniref:DUF302 domain-containing protein n=1 Tax=Sulfurovum sp. TaxID=1969726 RepID=UPI00286830C2|nr:DUF302 domain-containing protein [Sulfurovum sp.]
MKKKGSIVLLVLILGLFFALILLRNTKPVDNSRFVEPDKLYKTLEANIRSQDAYEIIVDIDHARLAKEVESPMPPSHVLIWSDPKLETEILKINPVAAVDLPLRTLAFEDPASGKAAVITNSFDFLMNRHGLPDDPAIRGRYETAVTKAIKDIPSENIVSFSSDKMLDAGLITLNSPYDFNTTETRIRDAINAQDDTVFFATVDFKKRAKKSGVTLAPLRLILFGAPGPGGKAMSEAPILGLDAFCQKMLIWKDTSGSVHVTFNDLLILAEHQKLSYGIPLRVINYRIKKTFSEALEQ